MTIHPASARFIREVARTSFSPLPPDVLARVLSRRAAGERVILPARPDAAPRRRLVVLVAAGLLVAAGTAAALPGSPLRSAIAKLLSTASTATVQAPAPAQSAPAAPPAVDTAQAGVSIPVRNQRMWVAIDILATPVRVSLRIADRNELEVRGVGAAASATFRPRIDGISVTQLRGGELRIDVPRRAPEFVLRLGGVELAAMREGHLRSSTRSRAAGSDSIVVTARP